jgi:hypothetical protein
MVHQAYALEAEFSSAASPLKFMAKVSNGRALKKLKRKSGLENPICVCICFKNACNAGIRT